jgi:ABC-type oligopeptide transport system substrate-binding subunit
MDKFFGITLFLIFSLLSGCEQSAQDASVQPASENQPIHEKYLRIPVEYAVSTIDPGKIDEQLHIELVEQLFLGLTDFDSKTYAVIPELATEWQISADSTRYVFKLRQDAKWNNGEPVTAHDVVWAIERNLNPHTNSPYVNTLFVIKNAELIYQQLSDSTKSDSVTPPAADSEAEKLSASQEVTDANNAVTPSPADSKPKKLSLGVRALDDYTVEFTLEHPSSYFLALVSLWSYHPLPRKTIEQYGDEWIKPKHIVTNGPYQLVKWQASELILNKNPYFYEADQVKIPEVHYYTVFDSLLGLAMYENNELDILGGQVYLRLPATELPRIRSNSFLRNQLQVNAILCNEWYGFNTQKPPTNNPLVRKAIAAAIDKNTLIDVLTQEPYTPTTTFTPPPVFGAVAPEEGIGIAFNPKQARAWLAEAGYPNGKNFPKIVLMYPTSSDTHAVMAQGIQTILKHYLNIDIDLQHLDFKSFLETIKQPTTPHLFRMGWCADYPDANNWLYEVLHSKRGSNWIGWNQPEFDQAVEQAQRVLEPDKRQQLYRRAEQILTEEEAAVVPLYFLKAQILVKPWVKNWYNMSIGGQHISQWYLEP